MPEAHPRRWQILAILCLCLVLIVASVSSLNVAIPSIARAISPTQTQILWIIDAYALVFAGLLLPAGALGDRFGRKGALLSGLAVFGGSAVAASMSDSPDQLIVLRGVMGVGAALIMPATLSIVTVVFPPEERAKAIAVWAGFAGAGGAIGSLSAGILLEWFWWGSVFLVNVPLVVVAAIPIIAIVPTSRDDEQRPLDLVGAALSILGFTSLVFGIIEGPEQGWTDGLVIGAFVVAVAALTSFVLWELRARHPMLDPRYFRIPRFALGSLTITTGFLVMFGMFLLITLYFQFVRGDSALMAAVKVLPFPVTMIAVAPRGPLLAARIGTRQMIALGQTIQAVGFVVFAFLRPSTPYAVAAVGMVLLAGGMALMMPPSTTAIVSSLPHHKAGVGSAVNDTTREVGGAIGIALLGSLLSIGYRADLDTAGLPQPAVDAARDSIQGAFEVARQVGGEAGASLAESARQAQTSGQTLAFAVAAAIALVMSFVVRALWPADDEPAPGEAGAEAGAERPVTP